MLDWLRNNLFFILLATMALFWLLMRTRRSEITSGDALSGIIGNGRPTVMEFFSNT